MNPKPDWWRTFFSGPVVDFWLRVPLDEATRAEADFLVESLAVAPGNRLLDVPCGGGRHALAMAARGFEVTGVDISPDLLAVARSLAEERELPITWEEREMRDLPWPDSFDAAYCFGNSFGYLAEGENADFLRAVATTLRPGGRFVLEASYLVECVLPNLQERAWYPDGEGYTLATRRYDPVEGRLHVAYTFIQDGKVETRPTSTRLHTCREVIAMLEAAGLTGIETYGSLTREPFRLGSPKLLAVATKGS